MSGLSALLRSVRRDVEAALERDPAAESVVDVVLAYPGFHARQIHRLAHALHRRGRHHKHRIGKPGGETIHKSGDYAVPPVGMRLFVWKAALKGHPRRPGAHQHAGQQKYGIISAQHAYVSPPVSTSQMNQCANADKQVEKTPQALPFM